MRKKKRAEESSLKNTGGKNNPVGEDWKKPWCTFKGNDNGLKQKQYCDLIGSSEITICAGPAGTGKSYISIYKALDLLWKKGNGYDKITLFKPVVEADEKIGFLPGSVEDKISVYSSSSLSIIDKIIGKEKRLELVSMGIIECRALAYIRGDSFDHTILILEEGQNSSPRQMKTLLTRIGEKTKYIINGDMDQSDRFKDYTKTGLYDVVNRLKGIEGVGTFEFEIGDIVRNPIISKILERYEDDYDDGRMFE
jgi:phosphate starvation-inducible protein PhoH and related proteins